MLIIVNTDFNVIMSNTLIAINQKLTLHVQVSIINIHRYCLIIVTNITFISVH